MYQALYRKYRPVDFDSVVGQDSIIKTLKNSIINHNFSHAYMFFGPRGTGKTTVSKIFARNINCLSPKDGIACQECDSCKVSFSKDCVDIIEIDAASNNGVDEIRDLKNKISLVPSDLKYKVYIIDEVHMLSIGAFNALLKTLEEPPAHAIFILATTDPQKVPETIISRCQCFSFKRISDSNLFNRLKFVCESEKILIDDDVLNSIAVLSDGGLRDALGSLDKLVSYTNERIVMSDFEEINGIVSNLEIENLFNFIFNGDIKNFLENINKFNDNGKNLIQIMVQMLNFSRNLIVDYYLHDKNINYSVDLVQNYVNFFNDKIFDMKKSGNPKIYIEMMSLKFINDYILCENTKNDVVDKVILSSNHKDSESKVVINNTLKTITNNFDNSLNNDIYSNIKVDDDKIVNEIVEERSLPIKNIFDIMKARANNTLVDADKSLLKSEISLFDTLNEYIYDSEYGFIISVLLDSKLRAVSSKSIILSFDYESKVQSAYYDFDKINDIYNKLTNSNKNLCFITDSEWDKLKNEYIIKFNNKEKMDYIEEPNLIFEENENNDIIKCSAVDLFGSDIVEID